METGLRLIDFLIFPVYLALILVIATFIRNRLYPVGHSWRPYFIPGLIVKVVGAIFMCLIYSYYYKGGDTILYFRQGQVINSAMDESFTMWFRLLTRLAQWYEPGVTAYTSQMPFYTIPNNYIVCSYSSVATLLSFNSYLGASMLFAVFSFPGIWALFRCFAKQYPQIIKQVAYATLFVPSLFFWGSGVCKDSICIFGLGWIIYLVFEIFLKRRISIVQMFSLLVVLNITFTTKPYIIIAIVPGIVYLILAKYAQYIKNRLLINLTRLLIIVLVAVAVPLVNEIFKQELGAYSLDEFAQTSNRFQQNMMIQSESESGSFYSLGELDPTYSGMLKKLPLAVGTTLFRPFIWEVKKPIMLIGALESIAFMLLTIFIVWKAGWKNIYQAIAGEPNVQFMLIFTIIFAFASGITTSNFGTLSRYKIPCMPTYALSLAIIYMRTYDNSLLTSRRSRSKRRTVAVGV